MSDQSKSEGVTWKARTRSLVLLLTEAIALGFVVYGVAAIYAPAALILLGLVGIFVVEREAGK